MSVISATREVYIRKTAVCGQHRQTVLKNLSQPIKAGFDGSSYLSSQLFRKDCSPGQLGHKSETLFKKLLKLKGLKWYSTYLASARP
jgi:hypothetical protein